MATKLDMNKPQDLFIHELGDIYDAEQKIAKMLPKLAKEAAHDDVRKAFEEHEQETRQQIKNLEQCFEIMGTQAPNVTCHAIEGLQKEHEDMLKLKPSEHVLTMFDVGAAAKTEHYEIASYHGLIEKAKIMGQKDCVRLLEENFRQEQEMSKRVEQIGKKLGQMHLAHA